MALKTWLKDILKSRDMPVSLLPYVYEGAVLTFTVDLDTGEETRRRSRVRSLLDKLQRTDRGKG